MLVFTEELLTRRVRNLWVEIFAVTRAQKKRELNGSIEVTNPMSHEDKIKAKIRG